MLPLPRPPPLGIPWEELRDEISTKELVIAGFFVNLASRFLRDQITAQLAVMTGKYSHYRDPPAEDQLGAIRAPP